MTFWHFLFVSDLSKSWIWNCSTMRTLLFTRWSNQVAENAGYCIFTVARSGPILTWPGTSLSTTVSRTSASRPARSGNQTCSCTTGQCGRQHFGERIENGKWLIFWTWSKYCLTGLVLPTGDCYVNVNVINDFCRLFPQLNMWWKLNKYPRKAPGRQKMSIN